MGRASECGYKLLRAMPSADRPDLWEGDMPLAYLPGNALRVRVRVAEEMGGGE
jgi:hypothetical protein